MSPFLRILHIFALGTFTWIFLPCLILACLFTTACTSPGPGESRFWAPSTWGKGSEGKAVEKAVRAEEKASAPVLQAARTAAHEAILALAAAPASRPVEVATHSATQAATLLDQIAGPLTAQEASDIRTRIAQLLSENEAIRAKAEKDRTDRDAALAKLSNRYQEAQEALTKAQGDLTAAFAREHAAANEARLFRARLWWVGGGIALLWAASQLLPLLAHAFPAVAPIAAVAHILQPGTAYVNHRLRTGLQSIGQALARMPYNQQAETIAYLDPHTDHAPQIQAIIRDARLDALPNGPPPAPIRNQ